MSGHTKGPWSVVEHDHGTVVVTESPKKTKYGASRYAAIGGFDSSDPEQLAEAKANARLIAAAPELLEFVRAFRDAYYEEDGWIDLKSSAKTASALIAKAEGK